MNFTCSAKTTPSMRKRATATTIVHENIEFRKPPANERVPFGVPIGELGEDIS